MLKNPIFKVNNFDDDFFKNSYFKGKDDPEFLELLKYLKEKEDNTKILETGIIETPTLNMNHDIEGLINDFPVIGNNVFASSFNSYGVCDNHNQILEKFPDIKTSEKNFCVALTPIRKEDQSSSGGWRWHKWGSYIGEKDPQCEYLYDETDIDLVYVFQILEIE